MARLRRGKGLFIFTTMALGVLMARPAEATEDTDDKAVTYQISPTHNACIRTASLEPPLVPVWAVDFDDVVSYPLIAAGRVFVTIRGLPGSTYGTRLIALEAFDGSTAWGPVDIPGTYYWSGAAYSEGQIFVVNFDGLLRAFDAGTGAETWSTKLPDQYAFSSEPTVFAGILYVGGAGSGGTLYAVNAKDGAVLWTAQVENGDHSSPAVIADAVFVGYACGQAYKFNRQDGSLVWHHTTACSGGGGRTQVYHRNRIYGRLYENGDPGYVLNADTGALLWQYPADTAPAFLEDLGFFVHGGSLTCRNAESGSEVWSFSGDRTLSTAPIIVNDLVYVGSRSGHIHALSPTTGEEVWRGSTDAEILPPDEHNVVEPMIGMSAAEGILVVPATHRVICYKSKQALTFRRADPNGDDRVNIADVVVTLRHVFVAQEITCLDAADCDDNGRVDVTDAIYLLHSLFTRGPIPPEPFDHCGADPTNDDLSCARSISCPQ